MSKQLVKRFGEPKPGHAWCSGYKRAPHQVPNADMAHLGRCRTCKGVYLKEWAARRHGDDFESAVPVPGNNGKLNLPQWGYRCAA